MSKKHLAIYITGGIAVYKAAQLVRSFIKEGYEVRVAMTATAADFVTAQTFEVLSRHRVYSNFKDAARENFVPHIALADWTDAAVVIPATANIIAKMANGLADDFVSTTLLATAAQKFVIPAMNDKMWLQPATKRNLAALKADGVKIMDPETGFLAEGYSGKGRMPEPNDVFQWLKHEVNVAQDLKGKKVLITAGPTIEEIDPVRYLTNHSSGKMGYALAKDAAVRGADVTLISGPTCLPVPDNVSLVNIRSARQLQREVEDRFGQSQIVIMSAAVSDYHFKQVAAQKIKKDGHDIVLELAENPDILAELGQKKKNQLLVGFAAETENLVENGTKKLKQKNLDMLVLNDVSRKDIGFNSEDNEVRLLRPQQTPKLIHKTSKAKIAREILDELVK